MGWAEVPYIAAPADLASLSRNLHHVAFEGGARIAIVPGVSCSHDGVPDVMRGEECQVLAVLARAQIARRLPCSSPAPHSKMGPGEGTAKLASFRTYMTGELYNALTSSGTLAQLMEKGEPDRGRLPERSRPGATGGCRRAFARPLRRTYAGSLW